MAFEQKISDFFRMTDEVWARHANPWSVWTRYSTLPILVFSVWSRIWIGWWSLVPIIASLAWIWLNPRFFNKPTSTNHWASKAVLGERVWLNRAKISIPRHHQPIINFLNTVSATGAVICILGLVLFSAWATVFGVVVVALGKSWFLDRMVWLYDEMKDSNAEYTSWLY